MTETLQQMSAALASLKGSLVSVAWQRLSCKFAKQEQKVEGCRTDNSYCILYTPFCYIHACYRLYLILCAIAF